MKNIYGCFSVFVLIVTCLACHKEAKTSALHAEQAYHIDVKQADTLLRHHIKAIDYIPLEVDDRSFLFGVNKLAVQNNLLYLGDLRAGKIAAYDTLGNVRFVLDKKGQGPEEYLEIKTFAVDTDYIYTLDNFRHALNLYDCTTGTYVKSLKMPFVAWDMEILPDGNFIFAYIPLKGGVPNMAQTRHKLFITDRNLNIRKSLFEYAEKEAEFIGRQTYFTASQRGVVFNSASSDDIYIFSGTDSVQQIKLQVKEGIPQEYRQEQEKIEKEGYVYWTETPFLCKSYIALSMYTGEYIENMVFSTKSGTLSANDQVNTYKGLLPPVAAYRDKLVAYLDSYDIYEELIAHGFERNASIEKHLEEEKPVLILYTMN